MYRTSARVYNGIKTMRVAARRRAASCVALRRRMQHERRFIERLQSEKWLVAQSNSLLVFCNASSGTIDRTSRLPLNRKQWIGLHYVGLSVTWSMSTQQCSTYAGTQPTSAVTSVEIASWLHRLRLPSTTTISNLRNRPLFPAWRKCQSSFSRFGGFPYTGIKQ